jgi:hypothetical protein
MISLNLEMDYEKSLRKRQDIEQMYRNVFDSPEGRKVLGDILVTCHFGVPLNNEFERCEYNVGVAIARSSGIFEQIEMLLKIGED